MNQLCSPYNTIVDEIACDLLLKFAVPKESFMRHLTVPTPLILSVDDKTCRGESIGVIGPTILEESGVVDLDAPLSKTTGVSCLLLK